MGTLARRADATMVPNTLARLSILPRTRNLLTGTRPGVYHLQGPFTAGMILRGSIPRGFGMYMPHVHVGVGLRGWQAISITRSVGLVVASPDQAAIAAVISFIFMLRHDWLLPGFDIHGPCGPFEGGTGARIV